MEIKKGWIMSACLLVALVIVGSLSGCATTSQIEELQMKTDQALQEAQHATDMAKSVESNCNEKLVDAEEEYKGVQAAADRAEKAADRAEAAADRAEAAAAKVQEMYDRITAK